MARLFSAMLGLVALMLVAVHPAAMAAAATAPAHAPVEAVAAAEAPPCHEAAPPAKSAKAEKPASGRAKADCCADGRCSSNCTPMIAFFRGLPATFLSFLRAALEAPVRAQVPLRLADSRERPPKIGA
jgi:hypothetical protein